MDYKAPVTITVRRTLPNVIEYTVTTHSPLSGDYENVWHANRCANVIEYTVTYFGPHTGAPARQVGGAASTLWRDDDQAMLLAFRRHYRPIRNTSRGRAERKTAVVRVPCISIGK